MYIKEEFVVALGLISSGTTCGMASLKEYEELRRLIADTCMDQNRKSQILQKAEEVHHLFREGERLHLDTFASFMMHLQDELGNKKIHDYLTEFIQNSPFR